MEEILQHFQTKLESIKINTGTTEDPEMTNELLEVETDDGQLTSKATLQLPAAYYDITNMNYSQAGEHIGIADTEITLKLAVRKTDSNRWGTIKRITKALIGTGGETFKGILKTSQKKTEYDDIFVYTITFSCTFYDEAAVPEYTEIEKPEGNLTVKIK